MWNDEDPPKSDRGVDQVVSSWTLVAAILFAAVAWPGVRYMIHAVDAILPADELSTVAIPRGREDPWSKASDGRCDGATEAFPGEPEVRPTRDSDTGPSSQPAVLTCEGKSANWFDLPTPAMTVEWEALH